MAQILCLSCETVYWHLAKLRKMFGFHKTCELLLVPFDAEVDDAPFVRLTPRGKAVIELFALGCKYREIAERLGISLSGVRRHREKMLSQNNCDSLLELIARCRKQKQIMSKENE